MQITLYKFSKKNNSTEQPTGGTTVNVHLKAPTSVLKPVFILNSNALDYNYCKWGDRYYYINDIVSDANNYTEYHCSVDALASWKSYIGSSTEYVVRSASQFDGYIIDSLYPMKPKPRETKLVLSTLNNSYQGSSFVVGVINNDTHSSGAITYYAMSSSQFRSFLSFMLDTPDYMNIDGDEISKDLQKGLINPFQYVRSVVWYPFNIAGYVSSTVKFGWWSANISCYIIGESDRIVSHYQNVTVPQHQQAAVRGKYLNAAPFRRMSGICYNFGHFIINPSYFIEGGNLTVQIDTDVFANQGVLKIADVAGNVVQQLYAPTGVNIPISQLSGNLPKAIGETLGAAVGLTMGNVVGWGQGVVSAVGSLTPQNQSAGSEGSKASYQMAPTILIEDYPVVPDSNQHNGRPLCQDVQINHLSGYIVVDNPDVDIPCTEQEKETISAAMASGFYYE